MIRVLPRTLGLSAGKTAGIFFLFGVLWIALTDWLVLQIAATEAQLAQMQALKGWAFIGLSTLLIFGLVYYREKQVDLATDRLTVALEQLQVIHRVFRHNLRNELNIFRGYVESAATNIDDEDVQHQLGRADNAAQRIGRINERFRIVQHPGTPGVKVFDLSSTIEAEVAGVARRSENLDLQVDLSTDAQILGGESVDVLVSEVFRYLLGRQSGAPRLRVDLSERVNEIELTVSAPGEKIPETEVEPLRAGGEGPLTHATGVDLWIIKWLADYAGGNLEIERGSDENVISVRFPEAPRVEQVTKSAQQHLSAVLDAQESLVIAET